MRNLTLASNKMQLALSPGLSHTANDRDHHPYQVAAVEHLGDDEPTS